MLGLLLMPVNGFALDEQTQRMLGEVEYRGHCAACHGETGKGDGPVAQGLETRPANLTDISRRNGGRFPTADIFGIIDGRLGLWAHGTHEMPVWGYRFRMETVEQLAEVPHDVDPEAVVRARIMSLISYLETLQVD